MLRPRTWPIVSVLVPMLGLGLMYSEELSTKVADVQSRAATEWAMATDPEFKRLEAVNLEFAHILNGAAYAKVDMLNRKLVKGEDVVWSDYDSIKKLRAKGFITKPLPHFKEWESQNKPVVSGDNVLLIKSDPVSDCRDWADTLGQQTVLPEGTVHFMGAHCKLDAKGTYRLVGKYNVEHRNQ